MTSFCLAAKRRVECAKKGQLALVFCTYFTMKLTAAAVSYEYVSTERCTPSGRPLVSRPEPAPGGCSLAAERRAARRPRVGREAMSLYS